MAYQKILCIPFVVPYNYFQTHALSYYTNYGDVILNYRLTISHRYYRQIVLQQHQEASQNLLFI